MTVDEFTEGMDQLIQGDDRFEPEDAFLRVLGTCRDAVVVVYSTDDAFLVYMVDSFQNCIEQAMHIARCQRCMARLAKNDVYCFAVWQNNTPIGVFSLALGSEKFAVPRSIVNIINRNHLKNSGGLN